MKTQRDASIRVIAVGRRRLYPNGMGVFAVRLLALLAVLLMPFGMAPAAAAPPAHHSATMNMPMGHCPDQESGRHAKGGIVECMMACAAALPAIGSAADEPRLIAPDQVVPALAQRLLSHHPEIATPPPRLS